MIDSSAWVEFLRGAGSTACRRVEALFESEIAVCDAVRMEALARARNERHLQSLRRLLARAFVLPTERRDYDDAAALYRICRREGETVRRLIDCLIAAVAMRAGASVLHRDADFDTIAHHTGLKIDAQGRPSSGGRNRGASR